MNEKRVLYYEFETPVSAFLDGKEIGLGSTNINDYRNYDELNQIFEITINSIFEQTN